LIDLKEIKPSEDASIFVSFALSMGVEWKQGIGKDLPESLRGYRTKDGIALV
jgi:hypothetical protein